MRRLRAVVLVAVAACYSPTAPSGAPCDPAVGNCPSGQTCTDQSGAFLCLRPDELRDDAGTDAAVTIDAPPDGPADPADVDGDGRENGHDNCPTVANSDQANEDADRFGDACDPCPISEDADPIVDADNDGVSDDCDPHEMTPGDRITYFTGFAGATLPAGLVAQGNWSFANGKASIALADSQVATLSTTLPTVGSETVSINYTPTIAALGQNYAGAGVFTHRAGNDDGIVCHLAATLGFGPGLWISQLPQDTKLVQAPFMAVFNRPYFVAMTRDGTNYNCFAEESDGSPMQDVEETVNGGVAAPKAGVRFRGTTATLDWLLIVTTP